MNDDIALCMECAISTEQDESVKLRDCGCYLCDECSASHACEEDS